jgi:hypothetical protein
VKFKNLAKSVRCLLRCNGRNVILAISSRVAPSPCEGLCSSPVSHKPNFGAGVNHEPRVHQFPMRPFRPFPDEPRPIQVGTFYFPPPCPAFCGLPFTPAIFFIHTYSLLPTYSFYLNPNFIFYIHYKYGALEEFKRPFAAPLQELWRALELWSRLWRALGQLQTTTLRGEPLNSVSYPRWSFYILAVDLCVAMIIHCFQFSLFLLTIRSIFFWRWDLIVVVQPRFCICSRHIVAVQLLLWWILTVQFGYYVLLCPLTDKFSSFHFCSLLKPHFPYVP